jgi:hypothetical protein
MLEHLRHSVWWGAAGRWSGEQVRGRAGLRCRQNEDVRGKLQEQSRADPHHPTFWDRRLPKVPGAHLAQPLLDEDSAPP